MSEENWSVCAECSVNERVEKLNGDGLCFWCTPEGKAEAERFQAKIAAAMVRAGAVPVRVGTAEAFDGGPDIVAPLPHERLNR